MLLRRMIIHVEDQNWFAIGIDFFIVVTGVFLGIQLGNWNDARADERAYKDAIARYVLESEFNLKRLNAFEEQVTGALIEIGEAIDALQSCDASEANIKNLNEGISIAMGTFGLSIQTNELEELTSSPTLLTQQSRELRQRLTDTKFRSDVFLREADAIELIPLERPIQYLGSVSVGAVANRNSQYAGADYSRAERQPILAVPFEDACQDQDLIKTLYTWERWQGALPAVVRILREDIEANLDFLVSENQ